MTTFPPLSTNQAAWPWLCQLSPREDRIFTGGGHRLSLGRRTSWAPRVAVPGALEARCLPSLWVARCPGSEGDWAPRRARRCLGNSPLNGRWIFPVLLLALLAAHVISVCVIRWLPNIRQGEVSLWMRSCSWLKNNGLPFYRKNFKVSEITIFRLRRFLWSSSPANRGIEIVFLPFQLPDG